MFKKIKNLFKSRRGESITITQKEKEKLQRNAGILSSCKKEPISDEMKANIISRVIVPSNTENSYTFTFDDIPWSRVSDEAKKQIIEIARADIHMQSELKDKQFRHMEYMKDKRHWPDMPESMTRDTIPAATNCIRCNQDGIFHIDKDGNETKIAECEK